MQVIKLQGNCKNGVKFSSVHSNNIWSKKSKVKNSTYSMLPFDEELI